VNQRRVDIALLLLVGFCLAEFTGMKSIGFSVSDFGDNALVQGGSHPALLIWDAVAIPLLAFAMTRETSYDIVGASSWTRRFFAFLVDFFVVMMTLAPVIVLIPLAAEGFRTGRFAWYFERKYIVASDRAIAIPLTLSLMMLMALYFALPIVRSKQTVGCYLLAVKVVPDTSDGRRFGLTDGLKRVALGFIGLCSWPFMWLLRRGGDGSTWYDRWTRCRVTLVRYT
jgi:uncharacterized RDD family membrane protein YckC